MHLDMGRSNGVRPERGPKLTQSLAAIGVTLLLMAGCSSGHGRLMEPPSRSSLFRFGYSVPANYLDNQLFCGGYSVQWEQNDGRCGVCGDAWDGPRDNEAGGKFANGIIVRRYKPNTSIMVKIDLTAAHKGWFEFRLCANNNPHRPVTHECLNRHLLELEDGTGSRFPIGDQRGMISIGVRLPTGLTCSQCVLQWKYNAGNSWGVDDYGMGCVGCGPQEQFYGCADIAVGSGTEYDTDYVVSTEVKDTGYDRGFDEWPKSVRPPPPPQSTTSVTYGVAYGPWPKLLPVRPTPGSPTAGSHGCRPGQPSPNSWCFVAAGWLLANLLGTVGLGY